MCFFNDESRGPFGPAVSACYCSLLTERLVQPVLLDGGQLGPPTGILCHIVGCGHGRGAGFELAAASFERRCCRVKGTCIRTRFTSPSGRSCCGRRWRAGSPSDQWCACALPLHRWALGSFCQSRYGEPLPAQKTRSEGGADSLLLSAVALHRLLAAPRQNAARASDVSEARRRRRPVEFRAGGQHSAASRSSVKWRPWVLRTSCSTTRTVRSSSVSL